jgi:hypothetical protein
VPTACMALRFTQEAPQCRRRRGDGETESSGGLLSAFVLRPLVLTASLSRALWLLFMLRDDVRTLRALLWCLLLGLLS